GGVEVCGEVRGSVEIEAMAFVAIRVGIFGREVEKISVAEREGIALVGIVVVIFRIGVVGVEEETVAHALPETDRQTAIQRFGRTNRVCDRSKIRERDRNTRPKDRAR